VTFQQTYGLIELGVLRSKSKSDDSLWVKIGGEGYDYRVINSLLEIKADSAMLGYLNSESPFTEDGWFKTNDVVEVDGEYLKILGRKSELINVGGDKVFPQEIENVILELNYIKDVLVYGEPNSIIGNIVCAKIQLADDEALLLNNIVIDVKNHCKNKLSKFKVPVKIQITTEDLVNSRFKKDRNSIR
jgi:acyl-CoA synthetase (AMP-forming)/AMP-acid ligase II